MNGKQTPLSDFFKEIGREHNRLVSRRLWFYRTLLGAMFILLPLTLFWLVGSLLQAEVIQSLLAAAMIALETWLASFARQGIAKTRKSKE